MATKIMLILGFRYRQQKCFLRSDQLPPKEADMPAIADVLDQLQAHQNLEWSVIRETKIHKVLKKITELACIPREGEFNFKERSTALLEAWNGGMKGDGEAAPSSAVPTKGSGAEKAIEIDDERTSTPPVTPETGEDAEAIEGAKESSGERAEEATEQLEESGEDAVPVGKKNENTRPETNVMDRTADGEAA